MTESRSMKALSFGMRSAGWVDLLLIPLTLAVALLHPRINLGIAVGALYISGAMMTAFAGRKSSAAARPPSLAPSLSASSS